MQRSASGDTQLQLLSPEGMSAVLATLLQFDWTTIVEASIAILCHSIFVTAGSSVYMTEVKVHDMPTDSRQVQHGEDHYHGNPITNKGTTLLGEFNW